MAAGEAAAAIEDASPPGLLGAGLVLVLHSSPPPLLASIAAALVALALCAVRLRQLSSLLPNPRCSHSLPR